jgi:hypothetical protein
MTSNVVTAQIRNSPSLDGGMKMKDSVIHVGIATAHSAAMAMFIALRMVASLCYSCANAQLFFDFKHPSVSLENPFRLYAYSHTATWSYF